MRIRGLQVTLAARAVTACFSLWKPAIFDSVSRSTSRSGAKIVETELLPYIVACEFRDQG